MAVKTLADVALTASEQTVTLSGEKWYIEHLIISKVALDSGNITLQFNGNEHFSAYDIESGKYVFTVPFPYVLEDGQTFKYEADAVSKFRVALIGTSEATT
jgi:hypothetical protein